MQTFDWIVVGNGLVGAAVSYELARCGFSVLLLDRALEPGNATRYSYGGIPYWSGSTALTQQLCREGIAKHRQLSEELEGDTEFRELDLVLTLAADGDPKAAAEPYASCATPPQFVSAAEAKALEPLLNEAAIAGAFTVRHGHVSPVALVKAYNQAFQRLGGTRIVASVVDLVRIKDRVTGILTTEQAYPAKHVLVAAGAFSRALLRQVKLTVPLYYTYAELIETPPLDLTLRALIMPAQTERFAMEAKASQPSTDAQWDQPGHELTPAILDCGAIQFLDGHLCLGQISRTLTNLEAELDAAESDRRLRSAIAAPIPTLANVPGTWRYCRVSFSRDGLPLVGGIPGVEGLHLMAGFSAPFVYLPPVAQRFAQAVAGEPDPAIAAMAIDRFAQNS
ncbi:FAD-binding oxidoreductase [Nodosilinea sp. LEGE 06152]|uniref:NAD(P)/FAD-dependent oxidoreductase n=1 Tax=Nodosilinea sp. LEGE 06152 TaxID=2777966 RepID=UPI0018821201|nr:FAD-binding oxidoreductase [Nodosilinea sp. LEGE 06152]MBE9156656.1 FAD-binding oxidoreductase [Nodosilinea sp. LEGE 06152]MBE9160503.1 FAD-binding oxidoreductase [Nodosilinea sp. LEGE 06152]